MFEVMPGNIVDKERPFKQLEIFTQLKIKPWSLKMISSPFGPALTIKIMPSIHLRAYRLFLINETSIQIKVKIK